MVKLKFQRNWMYTFLMLRNYYATECYAIVELVL